MPHNLPAEEEARKFLESLGIPSGLDQSTPQRFAVHLMEFAGRWATMLTNALVERFPPSSGETTQVGNTAVMRPYAELLLIHTAQSLFQQRNEVLFQAAAHELSRLLKLHETDKLKEVELAMTDLVRELQLDPRLEERAKAHAVRQAKERYRLFDGCSIGAYAARDLRNPALGRFAEALVAQFYRAADRDVVLVGLMDFSAKSVAGFLKFVF